MVVIGVDGGLTGAIAFLNQQRGARVVDLPSVPLEGGGAVKRRIHGPALRSIVRQHCPPGEPIIAVIEQLATGGQGNMVQTQNSQYRTRGTIECALECLGLELQEVSPARWKKFYGLKKKEKIDSLQMARDLYPELWQTDLKRAGDHNRAEAVLVAHWALKVLA